MDVTRITTGSWFPRTKLHLKEYFTFLKDGTSHLPIDKDRLKVVHDALTPEDISYEGGRFDAAVATMRGYDVRFTEDGLLTVSKVVENLPADIIDIRGFYDDRITKALSLIYEVGTPAVMHRIPHVGMRPIILLVQDAEEGDIDGLMDTLEDEVHFVAHDAKAITHFASNYIIIENHHMSDEEADTLVTMYLLFREYEHKLRHYLDLYRTIWESIADFRGKQTVGTRDLPELRDRLLDYRRDLAVTRGRLGQMESYLLARQRAVDAERMTEWLGGLEAYRFDKVAGATSYMKELWDMLDDYIESTVAITGLLYQENLQKEINFQQMIFLVGAMASLLTLGTIAGATITLGAPNGDLLASGELASFDIRNLLIFGGGTIFASIFIFVVIRPLASSFKRIKTKSLLRGTVKTEGDDGTNAPSL